MGPKLKNGQDKLKPLTREEQETQLLVEQGLTAKEIATIVGISQHGVYARIYKLRERRDALASQ